MGPPPSPIPSSSQQSPSSGLDLQLPALDHGTLKPIGEDGDGDEEMDSRVLRGVHTGSETKPEPSTAGGMGPGRPDQPMSGPSAPRRHPFGLSHQAMHHLQPAGLVPQPSDACASDFTSLNPAESAPQPSSVSETSNRPGNNQQQDQLTVGRPGSCEAGAPTPASDATNVGAFRQHPQQQQHQQDNRLQHPNPSGSSGDHGSGNTREAAGGPGAEGQQVWVWRTPLERTQPFWAGWYKGLSEAFLKVPAPKVLLLAGTDRLDKPLMVGQMQGRFQLSLLPQVITHLWAAVFPDPLCITPVLF